MMDRDEKTQVEVEAMMSRVYDLDSQGRDVEALEACNQIALCFGGSADPLVADQVGWSLWIRSSLVEKVGNAHKEEANIKASLSPAVAKALLEIGEKLRGVEHPLEAARAFDQVEHWFGDSTDEEVAAIVEKARIAKGS